MPMQLNIDALSVELVYKPIRRMHLRILPPDGVVQVTAPHHTPESTVAHFVREKRAWIARQQALLAARPRQTSPEYEDGQSVYLWGETYCLRLNHVRRGRCAALRGRELVLSVLPGDCSQQREALLNEWYRAQLHAQLEAHLPLWQARMGLFCADWQIKNMKTRWGTCNTRTKKLWFNLQLVKQPPACLDYVIVHELAHLRFSDHGAQFQALLRAFLPHWPELRRALNEHPFL